MQYVCLDAKKSSRFLHRVHNSASFILQADDFLIILCPFAAEAVDLCRKKENKKKKDKTEM